MTENETREGTPVEYFAWISVAFERTYDRPRVEFIDTPNGTIRRESTGDTATYGCRGIIRHVGPLTREAACDLMVNMVMSNPSISSRFEQEHIQIRGFGVDRNEIV